MERLDRSSTVVECQTARLVMYSSRECRAVAKHCKCYEQDGKGRDFLFVFSGELYQESAGDYAVAEGGDRLHEVRTSVKPHTCAGAACTCGSHFS